MSLKSRVRRGTPSFDEVPGMEFVVMLFIRQIIRELLAGFARREQLRRERVV